MACRTRTEVDSARRSDCRMRLVAEWVGWVIDAESSRFMFVNNSRSCELYVVEWRLNLERSWGHKWVFSLNVRWGGSPEG
jgi:hypothetical protein